jgi:hypothetical protein
VEPTREYKEKESEQDTVDEEEFKDFIDDASDLEEISSTDEENHQKQCKSLLNKKRILKKGNRIIHRFNSDSVSVAKRNDREILREEEETKRFNKKLKKRYEEESEDEDNVISNNYLYLIKYLTVKDETDVIKYAHIITKKILPYEMILETCVVQSNSTNITLLECNRLDQNVEDLTNQ